MTLTSITNCQLARAKKKCSLIFQLNLSKDLSKSLLVRGVALFKKLNFFIKFKIIDISCKFSDHLRWVANFL